MFFNTIQKSSNVKLVADDVVQKLLEQDSEHFQRYKCLMALDFEDDFGRTPTDEEMWNQMSELPSFLAKKGLPKPGRWFAWHECAHQQLKEFFATRCLLHWYFEDEGLPAPEEVNTKFQKCKGDLGGLKLLHRALTYVNHETACIMLLVSRPCWTWYTEQISEIKNPPGRSWATHDVGFVLVQRWSLAGHCENSVWLAVSEEVGVLPSAPRQNWWWWPSSNCVQICVKCPVKKIMDNVKVWHSSWVLCGTCLVMCRSSPGSHACDEERLAASQSGGTVGQMC